ncbi:hypothetical protein [Bacillus cereus group sp. FL70]|uniref:hypothetical protein n=1 Tax=Bacillus cereus group sp. FL70 TaxID=3040254 RepID=UPI00339255B1
MGKNKCQECIYCNPKYIIKDTYIDKEITYIHPIIHVNREYIRYIPHHVYEEETRHEVIDPGYPDCCEDKEKKDIHCKCMCRRKKGNCWSWL